MTGEGVVAPLWDTDPRRIGRFRLRGRLGSGGMGTVFLASADGGPAELALKLAAPQVDGSPCARARFRREARLAARVSPAHTARVIEHGVADGRHYLATEYIPGRPLSRRVRRGGPLRGAELYALAGDVAAALVDIHRAGLVHRDLKPSNVILSPTGARVIDFGIARTVTDPATTVTGPGTVVGSAGWMAPEQLTGDRLTAVADVFGWACLVTYAATARSPFGSGDAVAVAYRIVHQPPDLGDLAEPLRRLVVRAFAKPPHRRPPAAALYASLLTMRAPRAA